MLNIILQNPWIIVLFLLWTIPWKGAALWRSARRGHAGWFIVFLIINTLGILEILYLFIFSRKRKPKVQDQSQPHAETFDPRVYSGQAEEDRNGGRRMVKKIM
jgi:methionyl-tRNA synthetase